ncbi:MAG: hypothetical protein QOE73_1620, partial [Verrucomicrobiota bacterium]
MPRLDLASIAIGLLIRSYTVGAEPASDIPEVIVTATKRESVAQDTPISMTVLGTDALQTTHADNFSDFASLVPGLTAT